MKNGMMKGAMIAGALATMLAPAVAFAGKAAHGKGMACTGANDCKGKGSCKGASNDCKGMNDCKGHGMTTEKNAKACEAKGGTAAAAKGDKADKKAM